MTYPGSETLAEKTHRVMTKQAKEGNLAAIDYLATKNAVNEVIAEVGGGVKPIPEFIRDIDPRKGGPVHKLKPEHKAKLDRAKEYLKTGEWK